MSAFAFLRKLPWSFLFALALCAMAWGAKIALETQIGELTPFLLFFGAVMIATWNGGLGIGVFSALISAVLVEYYFLLATPLVSSQFGGLGANRRFFSRMLFYGVAYGARAFGQRRFCGAGRASERALGTFAIGSDAH